MKKDSNWYEGGSDSGLGGMKRFEARERVMERRVVDYPDGRRETIETITESDVKSHWFSARTTLQYKAAARTFEALSRAAAQQDMPLHNLQTIKNDIVRELEQRQPAVMLNYPGNKSRFGS